MMKANMNNSVAVATACAAFFAAGTAWAHLLQAEPTALFRTAAPDAAPSETVPARMAGVAMADPKRPGIYVEASDPAQDNGDIEQHYRGLLRSQRNANIAVVENGRVFLRNGDSTAVARADEAPTPLPGGRPPEVKEVKEPPEEPLELKLDDTLAALTPEPTLPEPVPNDVPARQLGALAQAERRMRPQPEPTIKPNDSEPPLDASSYEFAGRAFAKTERKPAPPATSTAAGPGSGQPGFALDVCIQFVPQPAEILGVSLPAFGHKDRQPEDVRRLAAIAIEARGRVDLNARADAGEWLVLRPY